jgi:hypothetical protein
MRSSTVFTRCDHDGFGAGCVVYGGFDAIIVDEGAKIDIQSDITESTPRQIV